MLGVGDGLINEEFCGLNLSYKISLIREDYSL